MTAPRLRVKVHCLGIIDRALVPYAVIAADVKATRGAAPVRYVLLSHEERAALSELWRAGPRVGSYSYPYLVSVSTSPDGSVADLPALVRAHHWDAAGKIADGEPIGSRRGNWSSAETLWVAAPLADDEAPDATPTMEAPAEGAPEKGS